MSLRETRFFFKNDVLFQKVTQAYSYQESNLRPSDY